MSATTYEELLADPAVPGWLKNLARNLRARSVEDLDRLAGDLLEAAGHGADGALAAAGPDRPVDGGGERTEAASVPGGAAEGGGCYLCPCECHHVGSTEPSPGDVLCPPDYPWMKFDSKPSPGDSEDGARCLEDGKCEHYRGHTEYLARLWDALGRPLDSCDYIESAAKLRGDIEALELEQRRLNRWLENDKTTIAYLREQHWDQNENNNGTPLGEGPAWTEAIIEEAKGRNPMDLIRWLPTVCRRLLQMHTQAQGRLVSQYDGYLDEQKQREHAAKGGS